MSVALKKKSHDELLAEIARLPEHMTGELVAGELHVMGRPSGAHQNVELELGHDLRHGGGNTNGWLILTEVEVLFPGKELVVPDLTGWRRENIAGHERDNPYTIRPDWVCEVLSPSTRVKDIGPKRRLYARHGVPHLWLIDPESRVLEAFKLQQDLWLHLGTWTEADTVTNLEPFPELTFELSRWWLTPA